ncbi:hypothetical protein ACOME3_000879 [Neoechinorhynchus agilis]
MPCLQIKKFAAGIGGNFRFLAMCNPTREILNSDWLRRLTKPSIYISRLSVQTFTLNHYQFCPKMTVEYAIDAMIQCEAGKYLAESVEFIKSDETLEPKLKDFVDNAKRVFLERYFRIHHKVSIEIVANAMQTSVEETKSLIEELIANKQLTGKFDETGMVVCTGLN